MVRRVKEMDSVCDRACSQFQNSVDLVFWVVPAECANWDIADIWNIGRSPTHSCYSIPANAKGEEGAVITERQTRYKRKCEI